MNKEQALKKYKKSIINQYEDADEYFWANDDPDLIPIKVPLPDPPDWHLIEGFGLPAKEHKWHPPVMPYELKKLQLDDNNTIEDIHKILESNQEKYAEEIRFIQTQWYHRRHGYWFFNNGKPTYITGCHYFYVGFWNLDIGLPFYKDRDRKFWLFDHFVETHTSTFANMDKKGNAIRNENGEYEFIDLGIPILTGLLYPKFRREGATYRSGCKNTETISRMINAQGGIQSRDDVDSKGVFVDKLLAPFNKLPFFFKPSQKGRLDSESSLQFDISNLTKKGGTRANIKHGLGSFISYGTGTEGYYDSQKLQFYHRDEVGKQEKRTGIDINRQWNKTKKCLWQQKQREGTAWFTSTIAEMNSGGGEAFKKLADASNFYQRNKNGETVSGLVLFFIPSSEGYIIDEYGNSMIKESEEDILAKRQGRIDVGDIEGWAEEVRQTPLTYSECYTSDAKDNSFNLYIIETRLKQLLNNSKNRVGKFAWEGEPFKSNVIFKDTDKHDAKCHLSLMVDPNQTNRKIQREGSWWPYNHGRFEMGVDPFRQDKNISGNVSNGSAFVFYPRDMSQDPDFLIDGTFNDMENWMSQRCVCDYLYRPSSKEEFSEDMLMMAIYFETLVYYENNCDDLERHFTDWGYKGYLKYDLNPRGIINTKAGFYANAASKEAVYNDNRDYIAKYGMHETHVRYFQQAKAIRDYTELNKYDLLAAAGICFKGMRSKYSEMVKPREDLKSLDSFVRVRYVK